MNREAYRMMENFEEEAGSNAAYAIAYAIMQLASQQAETARQINALGLANAATPMGALEVISIEFKAMAAALQDIASAIGDR